METAIRKIQMVDLNAQYDRIKTEVDTAVLEVISTAAFINGPKVKSFQANLERYLGVKHVIPCANGTDALQIAMMAADLQPGDEVIVPAFTYVATAEVIALLRLRPLMVDVDPHTFNITAEIIEQAITPRTKAIVPVHLFGQSCDMAPIMEVAKRHNLIVIEDNAQAIGSDYTAGGHTRKAGTIGHIGCTSFYPSKNLGCYGDGGAIFTNDSELAEKCQMIANHGQSKQRYYHDVVGVNSRLDSIQAAVLDIKLTHLDEYAAARQRAAAYYDAAFRDLAHVEIPARQHNSTHVFHQYTLIVKDGKRDALQAHLQALNIPTMIYYPVPLYKQKAYSEAMANKTDHLAVTDFLCKTVLSLPMHTELDEDTLAYICDAVRSFGA